MSSAPVRVARSIVATVVTLAVVSALLAAPASAGSASACRVRNLDSGVTRYRLQRAVSTAQPGDHLTLKGTCHGIVYIGRDLHIRGVQTRRSGRPTVDGDDAGTVITVDGGYSVVLRDLLIRDGAGGINNIGQLTLRDVVVRGNVSQQGAGAYNHQTGTLTLVGSTAIRRNRATWQGGGVVNAGSLVMRDQARIADNVAGFGEGGGQGGGGVLNLGSLTMLDSARISGNVVPDAEHGGGVSSSGTLDGVVCGPSAGANVFDNAPDDCYP